VPAQTKAAPKTDKAAAKISGPTLQLFKAVELNDMPGVKASIEAGADLYIENEEGMSAADLAVDRGHFIVAHYLLSSRLAGQTPPLALVPEEAKKKEVAAVKKTPKRRFATPPPKPPAIPKVKSRVKPQDKPEPAPEIPSAITEAPEGGKKDAPEAVTGIVEETIEEVPASKDGVLEPEKMAPETAPAMDKPLAKQGVGDFFKSLVDLITPGGEKILEPKKIPEPEKAPPGDDIAESLDALEQKDEAVIEHVIDPDKETPLAEDSVADTTIVDPDEAPIELTVDSAPGEVVEEITDQSPAKMGQAELETMIADTDLDEPEPKEKGKDGKSKSEEGGFLDRMAGLFTSEKNEAVALAKDGKAAPKTPAPDDIAAYELPLPAPKEQAPQRFSPRFMDRLADFLETGDEAEFKAWLPEMQVMSGGGIQRPKKPLEVPAETLATPDKPKPEKTQMADASKPPKPSEKTAKETPPEAPKESPGLIKGTFDKLIDVLTPDFGDEDRSGRVVLAPEEMLAPLEKKADEKTESDKKSKTDPKTVEKPSDFWPVTQVETAEAPPLAVKKPRIETLPENTLKGVTLALGESVSLENSFPPLGDGVDPHNRCVKKNRGTTLFCLETVDWPEKMRADFLVPTILYTGQKAIARYDQGIASRFHALFPADSFKRVAEYFHKRFGKPTDVWNRSIAPFAQPRQDNPTLAWRSIDPKTQVVTVLEIRKFDDSRGGFPDTSRGAVMLYLANSPSIFPQVSSHELMRLSRSRMAPPSDVKAAPGAPGAEESAGPPKPGAAQMTSEEMQAERRKRKAAEKAGKKPGGLIDEGAFELPPDPADQ